MNNIALITQLNKCTGCTCCLDCCPTGAIMMKENEYGFIVPEIDETKCTNCGLCIKKCPQNNHIGNSNQDAKIIAAVNKKQNIVLQSSSGGIFSLIAEYIIKNNGVVFGAAWDKDFNVKHKFIDNINDLKDLRGAKYVQSDLSTSFKKVKAFLDDNRFVLFSGTSCQIAGLKSYLGKEYEKLLTIDLICHGVPSRKVWREYLNQLLTQLKIKKESISDISFRNKAKGWKKSYFVIKDKEDKVIYNENWRHNKFNIAFDLSMNNACLYCDYSKTSRIGDISIGDFWGIEYINPKYYNKNGTSLIIVNNKKGDSIIEKIKNDIVFSNPIKLEQAIKSNYNIVTSSTMHPNRNDFLDIIKNDTSDIENKILNYSLNNVIPQNSICLLNYFFENTNYGALMVSFALTRFLAKYGYKTILANNEQPIFSIDRLLCKHFIRFKQKYFKSTLALNTNQSYLDLNNYFNIFIAGSDQIWNPKCASAKLRHFMFDFAKTEKILISYAASFGGNKFSSDKKLIKQAEKLLRRFDAISVREKSGIDIIKKTFGSDINCIQVLDPTLLLDEQDYMEILKDEPLDALPEKYIGHYILQDSFNHYEIEKNTDFMNLINRFNMSYVSTKFNKIKLDNKTLLQFKSFPNWLNLIKHSTVFVTDSFHGVCFSIIFKKNFVYIDTKSHLNERIISLLDNLGIRDRIFKSFNEVNVDFVLNNPIDYNTVYQNLNQLRIQSKDYLISAIEKSKDKDYLIDKLKKSIAEKDITIENLKKWNLKEIPKTFYYRIIKICGIVLKKMGTSFGVKIFKLLPKPIKEIIKNLISWS